MSKVIDYLGGLAFVEGLTTMAEYLELQLKNFPFFPYKTYYEMYVHLLPLLTLGLLYLEQRIEPFLQFGIPEILGYIIFFGLMLFE